MEIEETEKNLSGILYKQYWILNCALKYLVYKADEIAIK